MLQIRGAEVLSFENSPCGPTCPRAVREALRHPDARVLSGTMYAASNIELLAYRSRNLNRFKSWTRDLLGYRGDHVSNINAGTEDQIER
jgi:hypothetical protein